MENDIKDIKKFFPNKEELEEMNFAELALYIEQLNKLEEEIRENVDEGEEDE